MASQAVFLVSLIDIQAGTHFVLPKPLAHQALATNPTNPAPTLTPATLPEDPPAFTPEAYKPSSSSKATPTTFTIPHPDGAAVADYRPPYLAFFGLTVVCVGLPLGLIQGWARSSIIRITSLRPSGRIKIVTAKDNLLKWVRKEGLVVDTGVATEAFHPDGGKSSALPYVLLVALCPAVQGRTAGE